LALALLAIAGQLAFREVSLKVLTNRLDLAQHEARRIADTVARLGRVGHTVDFSRLRQNETALRNYVHERLARRFFIHHVEIRDRFGVRQLFFSAQSVPREPRWPTDAKLKPVDWPTTPAQVVRVPLGRSEGEVRVGISPEPVLQELDAIRKSLRTKVAAATAAAILLLVIGLFYVLHLVRKNRRLELSRQSAERASYVGLLASGLAHEIRNPLNAMNLNLQMLDEELRDCPELPHAEFEELVDSSKQEIKRLEQLVNNFLAYARPSPARFEPHDLNGLVHDLVRFLEGDFRQKGVAIETDLEPLLPRVELDEPQIKQALMNLLVNAGQVLKGGGMVEIRTRAGVGGEVVLEVVDNGPGIPEGDRDRVFEIFFSKRGGGTGLGLPIAKQIVERHEGKIELETEVGRGTTFRVRLPRRHDRSESPPEPDAGRPSRGTGA
jgi:signal transduction histidine kinase